MYGLSGSRIFEICAWYNCLRKVRNSLSLSQLHCYQRDLDGTKSRLTLRYRKERYRYHALSMRPAHVIVQVTGRKIERMVFRLSCRHRDAGLVGALYGLE
jgi:hypothetical protein